MKTIKNVGNVSSLVHTIMKRLLLSGETRLHLCGRQASSYMQRMPRSSLRSQHKRCSSNNRRITLSIRCNKIPKYDAHNLSCEVRVSYE